MMEKCVLITGATGFIGSHVVERFLSEGLYTVVAVVRKRENYKNVDVLREKGALLVEGRFYDEAFVEDVFRLYPIEHVIHLAAMRGAGEGSKAEYIHVNVRGTEVLLEKSLKHEVSRFIFVSSVGVFGTIPKVLPANAATELNGDSAYHASKIMAESKVQEFIDRGLDAYIVRPAITYGRGDNGFPRTLVELVRRRRLLLPFKDIEIHLLNVTNLAELLRRMVMSGALGQRIFIAADAVSISLKNLVDLIHLHYYRLNYPCFLKLPTFLFTAISKAFRIVGNEKWATRISLISSSWYYDIENTLKFLQFMPARTKDSFIGSMCL